jgi:hypothetical protein
MIFYARATRGLRRPSLDTRSGRPSSPPSREKTEERWAVRRKRLPSLVFSFPLLTGHEENDTVPINRMKQKATAFDKRFDVREVASYGVMEAAHYLRIPRTTIRD